MSTLDIALKSAISGLNVNQAGIATVTQNITNADTEGYTRKQLDRSTRYVAGAVIGVQIERITRSVSDNLIKELRTQASSLGQASVREEYFQQMQNLFGTPDSNSSLSAFIGNMGTALEDLAATPESNLLRTNAVNEAERLALQLNKLSEEIQEMRSEIDRRMGHSIDTVNSQLDLIVTLNLQINANVVTQQDTSDLEDQRDLAVQKISEYMEISTFERENGQLVVMMPDSSPLVNMEAFSLSYTPSSSLSASISGGDIMKEDPNGPVAINSGIRKGILGGLIELRDTALPNMQAQLEELATKLQFETNKVHNLGTAFPALNSLTGTQAVDSTDIFNGGTYSGTMRIAITDADGNFVDRLDLDIGTLGVSPAAVSFATFKAAVDGALGAGTVNLNASNQMVFTAVADSSYGISIGSVNGSSAANINDGTTDWGVSHFFGINDLFVGDNDPSVAGDLARVIAVRSDILTNPSALALHRISDTTTAIPVLPDTLTGISAGDNTNIQALSNLFNERLTYTAGNGLPGIDASFSEYSNLILANNANQSANYKNDLAAKERLVEELNFRFGSISGVNIDEELAQLVVLENAYNASARIISVVQELFDQLSSLFR